MKGQRRLSQGELPRQKQSNSNKDEATPPLFKEEQTIVHTRRHLETTVRMWQKPFGFGFEMEDTLLDYQQGVCWSAKDQNTLSTGLHVPPMKTQTKNLRFASSRHENGARASHNGHRVVQRQRCRFGNTRLLQGLLKGDIQIPDMWDAICVNLAGDSVTNLKIQS